MIIVAKTLSVNTDSVIRAAQGAGCHVAVLTEETLLADTSGDIVGFVDTTLLTGAFTLLVADGNSA